MLENDQWEQKQAVQKERTQRERGVIGGDDFVIVVIAHGLLKEVQGNHRAEHDEEEDEDRNEAVREVPKLECCKVKIGGATKQRIKHETRNK